MLIFCLTAQVSAVISFSVGFGFVRSAVPGCRHALRMTLQAQACIVRHIYDEEALLL